MANSVRALSKLERAACLPVPLDKKFFNPKAVIPYCCTVDHIHAAMTEFQDFLGFVNVSLRKRKFTRLETILMPANFSSVVGEFIASGLPKHCPTLARNTYHNGHPDLIPKGKFKKDAVQYGDEGIEIKASRYSKSWQGHNPEAIWLMIFVFDCNRPSDVVRGIPPKPFRFLMVAGAQLSKADWLFAGRSEKSRRTITASVIKTGYEKIMRNWIYRAPDLPADPHHLETTLHSQDQDD